MKPNLIPKITKWIIESDGEQIKSEEWVTSLVKKIVKEVRKDYLWELKADLENTINNVFGVGK